MSRRDSVIDLLRALAGPIVWAAHFFFLYLTEAFACAGSSSPTEAVRWSALAATFAALAVLALYVTRVCPFRRQDRTARPEASFTFAAPLALLSMVATLWTAIPALLLPACAPPFA